jgi:hypothetical protein
MAPEEKRSSGVLFVILVVVLGAAVCLFLALVVAALAA